MAARYGMRQLASSRWNKQTALVVTGTLAAGTAIQLNAWTFPSVPVHAESPSEPIDNRKPIYDDAPLSVPPPSVVSNAPPVSTPDTPEAPTSRASPTPTDRLATQIRRARLSLHSSAVKTENALDDALTETLSLERSFTSTVAGLAPPASSGERLLPGGLYVLVATMAGSIISRNRNILLRASVPAAVGIGAAYVVLPITMRNVGDLAWHYEQRYPVIAENHKRIQERVERFLETGKEHTKMGVGMLEDKVGEARSAVEGWVSKGK